MLKKTSILLTSGLAIVTLAGFFGHVHWFLDLFAHFRLQYIWIGVLLAAILAAKKNWSWVGIALTIVLLNTAVVFPTVPAGDITRASDNVLVPDSTRVYFANTYFENRDTATIARSVTRANPDVAIFAEIEPETFAQLSQQLPEYAFAYHHDAPGLFDLAVIARSPLDEPVIHHYADERFPSVEISLPGPNGPLRIIGTHPILPSGAELTHNRNTHLRQLARDIDQRPTLVMGDFNITPWSPVFTRFLQESQLTRHATTATWPTFLPAIGFRIPIDHVLTRNADVLNVQTGQESGADHLPVIVDVLY